ncbi:hypothetical protein MKW98_021208 [Papaver atlanticum]|uniref:Uncharacterized protein n=1 Tax=Papaver atlanticum TaxID=357466 RepID=A0AAD4T7C9_9MAGN|nr:hypothetical protein MKW98_021208 [Papaver atlanticum]
MGLSGEETKKKETVKSTNSTLEMWRSKLSQHRAELKHLLDDWKNKLPYTENRTEVLADLELLEKLRTLLELDVADGIRNNYRRQIAIIYALKKIGMLLGELDRILKGQGTISPDADFRDWIVEKLNNEDLEDYLQFTNAKEPDVLLRAAAKGDELEKQIITPETIRIQDVDGFKSRLEVYHKELEAAYNMNPNGNIKEERQDGGHQTMTKEVNSAKRAQGKL